MNMPNLALRCHAIRSGVPANALSRRQLTTTAADPMPASKALLLYRFMILTTILLRGAKSF
jgi:hypothetical protein